MAKVKAKTKKCEECKKRIDKLVQDVVDGEMYLSTALQVEYPDGYNEVLVVEALDGLIMEVIEDWIDGQQLSAETISDLLTGGYGY